MGDEDLLSQATTTHTAAPPARRTDWRRYWRQRKQPWRTAPEINAERQQMLADRRAIPPNVAQGVYPFKDMRLTRADVEWLLATHEGGRGPIAWDDESQRTREGLDLRGADLREVNLRGLPLAGLRGGLAGATDEQCEQAAVHLELADLRMAHLEGAELREAHLERALLDEAHLELATLSRTHLQHASCRAAHFSGATLRDARMEKADLYGAFCEGTALSGARLQGASLSHAHLEGASLGGTRLEGAFLRRAYLAGAKLYGAHLENAALSEAHLEGAVLRRSHLEGVSLADAQLAGKRLSADDLARIRRWKPDFPETLPPADLRLVFFDAGTVLQGVTLGDDHHGYVWVADVRWANVNLSIVPWFRGDRRKPIVLGDEREARTHRMLAGQAKTPGERLGEFEAAVRANRQLALALQAQGLNETAAPFAYRAQVLQRAVLRRQRRLGQWLFSHFLDMLAGYGYRPGRSVAAYVLTIAAFTVAYYLLGQAGSPHFSPSGALVFSVTSFHGRGFFPGGVDLENPITKLAAAEALVGLVIEISFIATFTQRFFGK
jgi:uncharacterized protein YjbI with pentapeptide repeats